VGGGLPRQQSESGGCSDYSLREGQQRGIKPSGGENTGNGVKLLWVGGPLGKKHVIRADRRDSGCRTFTPLPSFFSTMGEARWPFIARKENSGQGVGFIEKRCKSIATGVGVARLAPYGRVERAFVKDRNGIRVDMGWKPQVTERRVRLILKKRTIYYLKNKVVS